MAGYKETPRQKMIAMLYLVLTAMLALNVSKEILEAFKVVNESLVTTNENFTAKVNGLYTEFEKQYNLNQEKVAPFWEKAQEVQKISHNFISYLESVKYNTIIHTEGIQVGGENGITYDSLKKITLRDIKNIDNFSKPTNYLVGIETSKGKGYELEEKINKYREDLLAFIPEDRRLYFNIGLNTQGKFINADGSMTKDWVYYNFYHTILAADITIMNKILAEAKNAEFDIVNYLSQDISAKDFKFSKIEAKILANSSYVFRGDEYKAEIFVAAVDELNNPTVEYRMGVAEWNDKFSAGSTKIIGDKGIVHLNLPTRNLSPKEYIFSGRIIIKAPTGEEQSYPFSNSFTVAEPSANVSATKMNVFYRGVDNPIRISAAGIPDHRLDPRITIGQIQSTNEGYVVNDLGRNTLTTNEVTISIYARGENGSRTKLGEQLFRLKELPDPGVLVRGMDEDSKITKGQILANPYLICQLPEYVNFKYPFVVNAFSLTAYKINGESYDLFSTGAKLTAEMERYIEGARRGADIVFKNIKVKGPTGDRKIPALVLTIR
ncbi:MAG: gliding motility protein GldM [Bacteroidales bacterium]|jgi:gliding motility-associated protein GldM|nr:gliding motility protein GldM [Bacteroidales bacterium]